MLESLKDAGAAMVRLLPAMLAPSRRGMRARYLFAVLATGMAVLVRLAIGPQELGLPFVTFFPAAALAAVFGGLGPGLLATGIGVLLATYFFIPPFDTFVLSQEGILSGLVFCADALLVCTAIEAMHRYYGDYVSTVQALEETRAAEERARLAAEGANEAKSRFLAAASHDLRQPYQALRLYLAVLESRVADPELHEIVRHMDAAMTAGENLLQKLLDLSTLEAGLVVANPVAIPTAEFLAAVEARHRPVAEDKGLRFEVEAAGGSCFADPVLLARVLDNLIANAIRYTERGKVAVTGRRREGGWAFTVEDTGPGIPASYQRLIFEPFFQVGNAERDRAKGVGLGLAIVEKMAQLMRAEIALDSQPGRGARFTLTIPGDLAAAAEETPPAPVAAIA